MSRASFFSSSSSRLLALLLVFGLAFAIRMYDLTDLPLDFHPTRQLLSAHKARGLYYQTQPDGISTQQLETGIRQAQLKADVEPVVFEQLVAFTYRFTGEHVWIARIYASLFWLLGGGFLFLILRELISFDGAIVSTAYYLFYPYAVIASRSFQPDPLMVMLTIGFWWSFERWLTQTSSTAWRWATLAGILGGLAIFIKFSAAFFVIGGALGLALSQIKLRDLLQNRQIWLMAFLGVLPATLYLLYGIFVRGDLASQFSGRFIPSLLFSPINYLQWLTKVDLAVGGIFLTLGLLGYFLVTSARLRGLLLGLGIAYLVYGLFFDYHVATHDYYHLPLIPIVAVSLSPLADRLLTALANASPQTWARRFISLILLFGLFTWMWEARNQLKSVDYRPEAVMWAEVSQQLGDARVIGLTQDYGSRLEYWGLKTVATWPYAGDIDYRSLRGSDFSFANYFEKNTAKRDVFLVTDMEELDRQPLLKAKLFDHYLLKTQGDGYLIFDLRSPTSRVSGGS